MSERGKDVNFLGLTSLARGYVSATERLVNARLALQQAQQELQKSEEAVIEVKQNIFQQIPDSETTLNMFVKVDQPWTGREDERLTFLRAWVPKGPNRALSNLELVFERVQISMNNGGTGK